MDQQELEAPAKKKPGPAPKPKVDTEALERRVHNLEQLVIRMAHNSGTAHTVLMQAGLTPYSPTTADMNRFHKVASS